MAYIRCEQVSLGYDGRVLIDGINCEVKQGDYLCIVGENGTGKSTLIQALLGQKAPMNGTITRGEELTARGIGYVPQQTGIQREFPASVMEVVMSGRIGTMGRRPWYRAQDKQIAKERMEQLGLWELRKRCYGELSGGQQQRVLLARALCATTQLLILDEPVSGLDPKMTEELYLQIEQLNKSGISIVMVSHDLPAALSYATHILHLERKDVFYGDKEAYRKSKRWKRLTRTGGADCE